MRPPRPHSKATPAASIVRITGTLLRDARHLITTGGEAFMELRLRCDAGEARAMRSMGRGGAAQLVCASEARRYRRGERAVIYARGFTLSRSEQAIDLVGVDHAELLTPLIDRITPEREEAV